MYSVYALVADDINHYILGFVVAKGDGEREPDWDLIPPADDAPGQILPMTCQVFRNRGDAQAHADALNKKGAS
jgi:hypothetical protein